MKTSSIVGFCQIAGVAGLLALGGTGCATNGRYVLLKEYAATGQSADSCSLQGATICLKGFATAPELTSPDPASKPEQPDQFKFVDYAGEQEKAWSKESKALKKNTTKEQWRDIGSVRNLFGMVMSHVYALNEPGSWLTESLKLDLERQGAKVVDASQAESADVVISGTVQFCRVDIYMKIWSDLVVDVELQPKNGAVQKRQFHTAGGTAAAFASTAEFYKPLRESRQKCSWLVSREIAATLKQNMVAR
jgi:hypothetical protein